MKPENAEQRQRIEALEAENARLRDALEISGKATVYRDGFSAAVDVVESTKLHASWGPAATPDDGLRFALGAVIRSLRSNLAALRARAGGAG